MCKRFFFASVCVSFLGNSNSKKNQRGVVYIETTLILSALILLLTSITPLVLGIRFEARASQALRDSAFEISRLNTEDFGISNQQTRNHISQSDICSRYKDIISSHFESFTDAPINIYVDPVEKNTDYMRGGFMQQLRVKYKKASIGLTNSVMMTFVVPRSPMSVTCIPDGSGVIFP